MSIFGKRLRAYRPGKHKRRWLFVPYDQLSDGIGPLSREPAESLGIVLVECPAKAARRPYHKQKLAFVIANLRQFALEQAARGVAVRHVVARGGDGYGDALRAAVAELGPLRVMEPAERELRLELAPLVAAGQLEIIPHEGWLTTREQFDRASHGHGDGQPPYRMDTFYALVRRDTGILMAGGKPVGGRMSLDAENRKPWRGRPAAPTPPRFPTDPIKDEVLALIRDRFASHPGTLDGETLPATRADAEALWSRAKEDCLANFGPFEDAMSVGAPGLFHTRISPLLNLHRLLPRRVLDDALAMDLPLPSQEGFARQVLGWREFVRHVHAATDGMRRITGLETPDAAPSKLGARSPLPAAYWGTESGLFCLDRVVSDVWREGWSNHITRLMVLSNIAQLIDASPRELTDWFWEAYVDAYDWVVEPNVLGMGTFAAGDLMITKPYVAGAAYIHRMSDYCEHCAFDPKKNCPLTRLYWQFLSRNENALAENPRLRVPLSALRKRAPVERATDERAFKKVRALLEEGERLTPEMADRGWK